MSNNLFHSFSELSVPIGSSAYFNNPLSNQGALALVNDAGNITINTGNLLIRDSATVSVNTNSVIDSGSASDNTSINPTNVNSTGSGGNISISVSNIWIAAKPVPEPTLPFNVFAIAAFYAAWRLKRKQKQTHKLKA
ncbi:hypothetical protein [Nostoc sp. TCL240-02]|uniref:hypothetical protein n=1 Tax=Nostoc sp. TCL240-02 TaxID=2572090 RepID=UPI00157F855E|nr:hypothetical protein [Nostoc sp. TCL240-02]QKQ73121.1 hypothetical protein FBB35_06745 [Nostoc sp. TCL240-02]